MGYELVISLMILLSKLDFSGTSSTILELKYAILLKLAIRITQLKFLKLNNKNDTHEEGRA